MKDLKNNQLVIFNDGINYGSGFVKGFASVELPVVGRLVIVEHTTILTVKESERVNADFDCIAVHECHIY